MLTAAFLALCSIPSKAVEAVSPFSIDLIFLAPSSIFLVAFSTPLADCSSFSVGMFILPIALSIPLKLSLNPVSLSSILSRVAISFSSASSNFEILSSAPLSLTSKLTYTLSISPLSAIFSPPYFLKFLPNVLKKQYALNLSFLICSSVILPSNCSLFSSLKGFSAKVGILLGVLLSASVATKIDEFKALLT